MARHTHPATQSKRHRRSRRARDMATCQVNGKLRHRDHSSAVQALHCAQNAAAHHSGSRRREVRTYQCPHCLGWHLTSQLAHHPAQ